MHCPCGSNQDFAACCEVFLNGSSLPESAEQLMRSRYTAFARKDVAYLKKTLAPEALHDFDEAGTKKWAEKATWQKLEILSTEKGGANDKKGVVEFVATFEQDGQAIEHHEVATFRKSESGRWYFVDGDAHVHKAGEGHHHHHEVQEPIRREMPKIGRNDPCHCGSGKKFKKCCAG